MFFESDFYSLLISTSLNYLKQKYMMDRKAFTFEKKKLKRKNETINKVSV